MSYVGKQGWRSGESNRFPPMWPGFKSRRRSHMWVEFVVGSPLCREVFLRVLRFSPLLKNQHFKIPIRSGTHGHVLTSSHELLSTPWVNKFQFTVLSHSCTHPSGRLLGFLASSFLLSKVTFTITNLLFVL